MQKVNLHHVCDGLDGLWRDTCASCAASGVGRVWLTTTSIGMLIDGLLTPVGVPPVLPPVPPSGFGVLLPVTMRSMLGKEMTISGGVITCVPMVSGGSVDPVTGVPVVNSISVTAGISLLISPTVTTTGEMTGSIVPTVTVPPFTGGKVVLWALGPPPTEVVVVMILGSSVQIGVGVWVKQVSKTVVVCSERLIRPSTCMSKVVA